MKDPIKQEILLASKRFIIEKVENSMIDNTTTIRFKIKI
jgi:hypothetical protein